MEILVSNRILIKEPTSEVIDFCQKELVVGNPEYSKRERLGKWVGNIQPTLTLYQRIGKGLVLPFGIYKRLWEKFKDKATFKSGFRAIQKQTITSNINLYEYQEKAVQSVLKAKNGVLIAPCGSGKTQMALETISRIGGRALWLTHTGDLLTQSKDRAFSCLDLKKGDVGTITGGKVNIGTKITFATIQTMSNLYLEDYKDVFDVVIVDECHHAIGSPTKVMMFYSVINALNCRYKIGVTATEKRADGLERTMFSIIGDVVHRIDKKEVAENTCPIKVVKIKTDYKPNLDLVLAGDGTIVYSGLLKDLSTNIERNEKIAKDVASLNGSVLVLADRIEHLHSLYVYLCQHDKKIASISGTTKKADRKYFIEMLNNKQIDVLLATYKLAKEGLDVPTLDYVVFASPQQDETTVIQSVGRVGRKAKNKEYGTVIDYVDDFGLLKKYEKKRERIYKKLGCFS